MTPDEVRSMWRSGKRLPLQKPLQKLGIPRERFVGGPYINALLDAIAPFAKPAPDTPTGFTVSQDVVLTFDYFRALEAELERPLINSSDVLGGSIQIAAWDPDQTLEMLSFYHDSDITWGFIDLRELRCDPSTS